MKRFNSAQDIILLIDKYKDEMLSFSHKADNKDILADRLRDTEESYRCEELRRASAKFRKQVLWREARLVTLGDRLSVIRTPQLVGVDDGDSSIPSV